MINEFNKIKEEYNSRLIEKKLAERDLSELEVTQSRLIQRVNDSERAASIIHLVAQQTQQNLEFHISNIVTFALKAIDPGDWPEEFVVRFEVRGRAGGDQTECDMFFKEAGEEYIPELGSGGGPLNVASFALRIAHWSLKKNRPAFVLDEPFAWLSPDLQDKASQMVKRICDDLGVQIILISHAEDIQNFANREIYVSKSNGRSSAKVTENDSKTI